MEEQPLSMASPLKLPYRYRVTVLLYFLILITYLDRVTISLVGVRIKNAFHLSNAQFGWVLGAFSYPNVFGLAVYILPLNICTRWKIHDEYIIKKIPHRWRI